MRLNNGLLLTASAFALAGAAGAAETVSYGYDSLGRLVRVTRNGGVSADYSYDRSDNRSRVVVTAAPLPAPVVTNGSFEAPEMGTGFYAYAYNPNSGFTGNSGIAANGSGWGFAAAPDGDQVAFVQNGPAAAIVSLQVSGLVPGASYKVSFRMSGRPGYVAIPLTLAFDGQSIGTFQAATASFAAATSPAFTATASSGTLTFTGIATADYYTSGIDLVTVAPAGGQP